MVAEVTVRFVPLKFVTLSKVEDAVEVKPEYSVSSPEMAPVPEAKMPPEVISEVKVALRLVIVVEAPFRIAFPEIYKLVEVALVELEFTVTRVVMVEDAPLTPKLPET